MEEETTLTIRLPKSLKRQAKAIAKKKDITLSQAIRQALRELAQNNPDKRD